MKRQRCTAVCKRDQLQTALIQVKQYQSTLRAKMKSTLGMLARHGFNTVNEVLKNLLGIKGWFLV